jgi:HD-GYP domain-containing protein (c-di-GMP phosphodiesterase class II)
LRAAGIPLESRILAVCDAWASITSERPYRFARTAQEAAAELRACAATQFDPAIVEALVGPADEPGN